jgi:hypothetical protein
MDCLAAAYAAEVIENAMDSGRASLPWVENARRILGNRATAAVQAAAVLVPDHSLEKAAKRGQAAIAHVWEVLDDTERDGLMSLYYGARGNPAGETIHALRCAMLASTDSDSLGITPWGETVAMFAEAAKAEEQSRRHGEPVDFDDDVIADHATAERLEAQARTARMVRR